LDGAVPSLQIKNVDVVTLNDSADVLRGIDVAIQDGTIVALGDAPEGFEPEDVLDGDGLVALPGFWNAHTHAAMMKDFQLLTLDEERILWEAERRAFDLVARGTRAERAYP
jgi:cytosine/adenosine deaminase-related metal-dependent hydrolase